MRWVNEMTRSPQISKLPIANRSIEAADGPYRADIQILTPYRPPYSQVVDQSR
jgi:hypothetical protein